MVGHPILDGGNFLPPHGRVQGLSAADQRHGRGSCLHSTMAGDWVVDAMNRYKRTGCKATREALVIYYMEGYVRRVASRLASLLPRCIDPEDLVQAAYFGLCDCLEKYDPRLNSRFEGYSHRRIEGAMRDYLRKEDPASRLARSRSKSIARGIDRFKAEFGRPPTDEELRGRLKLDEHEFITVMRDVHVPCTVTFQPNENDGDDDPMASIHVEMKNSGASHVDRVDLHRWLYQQLDRYDRLIVTLYYCECLSLLEIGGVLGYSESRVSQRLKQIHALLKTRINDDPEIRSLMAC